MTSIQEFGWFLFRKRRPTASTAPKYCRAIVSVTTATLGVPARSRASKTRPCSSGMRSVSKKPGPAQIIEESPVDRVSSAAPSTTVATVALCIGRPYDSAADCTPGTAAIRRSSSSYMFTTAAAG
jgi:hypothetical protein